MFGKKILSIIGLLLVGSQISSVKAACTISSVSGDNYTLEGDECETNGYYVAFVNGDGDNQLNDATGVTGGKGKLIKVSGSDKTSAVVVTDIGYFISPDGQYISNDHNGDAKLVVPATGESGQECSGKVGELVTITTGGATGRKKRGTTVELCLTSTISVALKDSGSGKNYLMENAAGNIFSNADSETYPNIVIKDGDKSLTFNSDYGDSEYCVYGSNEIQDRITNFCSGTILDAMYSCEAGLCSQSDSPVGAGNYIVQNGDNYNLYECTVSSGTVTCEIDEAANHNGVIVAKEVTDEVKEYTFLQQIQVGDLATDGTISEANLGKISVFDCVSGACKPTDALIKYGTSSTKVAYCQSSDGTACTTSDPKITLANIGEVTYSESNFIITIDGTSSTIASGNVYAYAGSSNAFAIIKNNGDAVVGKAKFADSSVYVKTDNTLTTSAAYGACETAITPYTEVDLEAGTATAGTACVPTVVCELSATAAENVHCGTGYYLKSTSAANESANLNKPVKVDEEPGTLYECSSTADGIVCDAVTAGTIIAGYYKNSDEVNSNIQYIKCSTKGSGSCTAVAVTDNACSEAKVGGLIVDEQVTSKISICIDENDDHAVELSAANASAGVKVFISIDTTTDNGADAFGTKTENSFVLLDVGVNCLKNESDTFPYRYTGPDQILVKRTDSVKRGEICNAQQTMKEFKQGAEHVYTDTTPRH